MIWYCNLYSVCIYIYMMSLLSPEELFVWNNLFVGLCEKKESSSSGNFALILVTSWHEPHTSQTKPVINIWFYWLKLVKHTLGLPADQIDWMYCIIFSKNHQKLSTWPVSLYHLAEFQQTTEYNVSRFLTSSLSYLHQKYGRQVDQMLWNLFLYIYCMHCSITLDWDLQQMKQLLANKAAWRRPTIPTKQLDCLSIVGLFVICLCNLGVENVRCLMNLFFCWDGICQVVAKLHRQAALCACHSPSCASSSLMLHDVA